MWKQTRWDLHKDRYDMKIQIEELKGKTAFAFCRGLKLRVEAPDESLEVYRGDTLSFTVSSIKWGCTRQLTERSKGGFIEEKYRPVGR